MGRACMVRSTYKKMWTSQIHSSLHAFIAATAVNPDRAAVELGYSREGNSNGSYYSVTVIITAYATSSVGLRASARPYNSGTTIT